MTYRIAIDCRKIEDFGIGTYIRNLITNLADFDHDNTYLLFTGLKGREELQDLPANFQVVLQRSPVYSIRELVALSWQLARLKVDLYHSTHYILPLLVPCRSVVTIHDIIHLLYPEFLPNRLAFFYAENMIRHSLQRGDRIVAVSQNTKSDLMSYFSVDGEKIEVIYNGIDSIFRQEFASETIDQTLADFELERPYLLFVGNPKPHKNLDNVVKAYAKALRMFDFPHSLVVVGDRGEASFKIRQRASQLGIEDRLKFIGHVEQSVLPILYQAADLFLYPTLYEGFGLPVIEAMASGTPVITSNTSALKEVAAGYSDLVNPLDIDGLAKKIVQSLRDEEHRASLSKLGRRRAQDFRCDLSARKTFDLYMSVLDPGGRGSGAAS